MTTVSTVSAEQFDRSAGTGPADVVRRVAAAAETEDGAPPLDEAALLSLRHGLGSSTLWVADEDGFGWRHDQAVDVVVDPAARGRGLGGALAAAAVAEPGPLTAWSHGNHPAAVALASRHGFRRVRDLWVMRRPTSVPVPPPDEQASPRGAEEVVLRTFEVGRDEEAFLALNAQAFAQHPEQGNLTRADLDERMAEPWFDAQGFFLAVRAEAPGEIVGFHWTKMHDGPTPYGEVYVVGVSPSAQGLGLGRRLTAAGLLHLASAGLSEVILYVEADNAPAVTVYQRLGFTHAPADTHVQYARGSVPA